MSSVFIYYSTNDVKYQKLTERPPEPSNQQNFRTILEILKKETPPDILKTINKITISNDQNVYHNAS